MRTASLLNHFLTSLLIPSHSLSTSFANFVSTSPSVSKIVALAFRAFASGRRIRSRLLCSTARHTCDLRSYLCRCSITKGFGELLLDTNDSGHSFTVVVQQVDDGLDCLARLVDVITGNKGWR